MTPQRQRIAALLAVLVVAAIAVAALVIAGGGSDSSDKKSPSASASASPTSTPSPAVTAKPKIKDNFGVKVTGDYGKKPKLTIKGDAPKDLTMTVLKEGDGPEVKGGQALIAHYLGQTWKKKDGKVNIFDNSYDRDVQSAFTIGVGGVIPGWDSTIPGQKIGSRLLISVPPELGYGEEKSKDNELAGETLVFVIDVYGAYDEKAAGHGEAVTPPSEGLPQVESKVGQPPVIKSTKGVSADGDKPRSALLIKGDGDPINPDGKLIFQFTEADGKTGASHGSTWETGGAKIATAKQILDTAPALKDAKIGSRVAIVTPSKTGAAGSTTVVVVDVIDQLP